MDDLNLKIVLDNIDQAEIMRSVDVISQNVKTCRSNVLDISVELQNNYKVKNMPEVAGFVVDGTLKCDVYAGDLYVGKCNLPLPKDGIKCGEKGVAAGYCDMYAMHHEGYTVKIQPNKLWVMEQ